MKCLCFYLTQAFFYLKGVEYLIYCLTYKRFLTTVYSPHKKFRLHIILFI